MIKQSMFLFVLFLGTLSLPALSSERSLDSVSICDDDDEWPPYTFYERKNGHKTDRLTGYSVELVGEIFRDEDVAFQISLQPWKRCYENVKQGKVNMFLSGTVTDKRNQDFYISKPAYTTHGYYFYSTKFYPQGLKIKSLEDLKSYRIGGRLGCNYTPYGIDETLLRVSTFSFQSLVQCLNINRCDLFLEKIELLTGHAFVNSNVFSDQALGYAPIPGAAPETFHIMFTKSTKGLRLKSIIDAGIGRMEEDGRLKGLHDKYIR